MDNEALIQFVNTQVQKVLDRYGSEAKAEKWDPSNLEQVLDETVTVVVTQAGLEAKWLYRSDVILHELPQGLEQLEAEALVIRERRKDLFAVFTSQGWIGFGQVHSVAGDLFKQNERVVAPEFIDHVQVAQRAASDIELSKHMVYMAAVKLFYAALGYTR